MGTESVEDKPTELEEDRKCELNGVVLKIEAGHKDCQQNQDLRLFSTCVFRLGIRLTISMSLN